MSSLSRRLAALAVVTVIARSLVWIVWEQSHFDSDQAIFGLMARHLAEGRARPVFMYGQTYMLSVESWLAAPLFAIFGASVALLKLPLLALNVFVVIALFRGLTRDAGLSARDAFVACLFFSAVPPITASRLVEAAGGNIEPFVYALLLWLARSRPVAFGLIAGVGVAHREFTWYAIAAILVLDWWSGTLMTWLRARQWAVSGAAMAVVVIAITRLAAHTDVLGPGTAGMSTDGLLGASESRLCLDPASSGSNLVWLVERNLSVIFGWRPEALSDFNVASRLTTGHVWAALPIGTIGMLAGISGVGRRRRRSVETPVRSPARVAIGGPSGTLFPAYLVLVGGQAALVYALASCAVQRPMLIRYTLLAILAAVGATAGLLRTTRSPMVRKVVVGAAVVWASASLWDGSRLLVEYVRQPPPNRVRQLIAYLDQQGLRFGRAPYWTAYVVDFVSNERITLASTDLVRIDAYQQMVDRATGQTVGVTPAPPCDSDHAVRLQGWCIERLPK